MCNAIHHTGKVQTQKLDVFKVPSLSFSLLLQFNPIQQSGPSQLLTHVSTSGIGDRVRRVKAGKLMGWDKDSLIGEAKAACTAKHFSL